MDLIRIIFAILLPPLGVFLRVGFAGAFWLNILLTLLGYIPASFTPSGSSPAADRSEPGSAGPAFELPPLAV